MFLTRWLDALQANLPIDLLSFSTELILCSAIVLLLLLRLFSRLDRIRLGTLALCVTLAALAANMGQWMGAPSAAEAIPGSKETPIEPFAGMLAFDNFTIFLR